MISIHDNLVYGFATSTISRRFVLHTKFQGENRDVEFTDVVFDGVVAMQLDDICVTQSILNDVRDTNSADFFDGFENVFQVEEKWGRKFPYLWLPFVYESKEDFVEKINIHKLRCFEIDASWGLNGFVIAATCKRTSRSSAADVA